MILHKMLFLKLPYQASEDLAALHDEILRYHGFHPTPEVIEVCERRHIPSALLLLLEKLLDLSPEQRPNAERVKLALSRFHSSSFGAKLGKMWKQKFRDKAGLEVSPISVAGRTLRPLRAGQFRPMMRVLTDHPEANGRPVTCAFIVGVAVPACLSDSGRRSHCTR